MGLEERKLARLRMRFDNLGQACAHVHRVPGRALFFFRDPLLVLPPQAAACLEWTFGNGTPHRILHGRAVETMRGAGVWIELVDTRPLRELDPLIFTRRAHRLGTDLPLAVRSLGRPEQPARMLDLSSDGARLSGLAGVSRGESLELRLRAEAGAPGFRDLGSAFVAWTEGGEAGVAFDRLDAWCRVEVARLFGEVEDLWSAATSAQHPRTCCGEQGRFDPAPPRLPEQRAS